MRNYGLLMIVISGLLVSFAGCRSHTNLEEPAPPTGDELTNLSLGRLEESPDPAVAIVQGLLTLEGLTVTADEQDFDTGEGGSGAGWPIGRRERPEAGLWWRERTCHRTVTGSDEVGDSDVRSFS